MRLAVIGIGYVGLTTGVCFAEFGNSVIGVDLDSTKMQSLNRTEVPMFEPGLDVLVRENLKAKRLTFTTDIEMTIKTVDICFICVGTPSDADGNADLRYVFDASKSIGKYMTKHLYIVNKSTVPVGTADKMREIIQDEINKRNENLTFDVISNPEFLKEGTAINDCQQPDRVIIGADNPDAVKIMKDLYKPFFRASERFISMDVRSAEMTKYVANAMLATKISFMNEMANICESVGANINNVRIGIGSDHRIGYHFIYPGCGYGGSCFPKDVRAIARFAERVGCKAEILKAVDKVNDMQKSLVAKKIIKRFGDTLTGKIFAVWGLSFKPNTDDMREASSIIICNELTERGAILNVYDPKAMLEARKYFKGNSNVSYFNNKYEALNHACSMILVTEWKEFRSPDFYKIKKLLKEPIIFDGRNQYDQNKLEEMGFEYYQIGVGI